jgi:hypothetical protein
LPFSLFFIKIELNFFPPLLRIRTTPHHFVDVDVDVDVGMDAFFSNGKKHVKTEEKNTEKKNF